MCRDEGVFGEVFCPAREGGEQDRKNFAMLRDDNGMVLTLMQGAPATVTYPRTFHIGFIQESEEQVNALDPRLKTTALT